MNPPREFPANETHLVESSEEPQTCFIFLFISNSLGCLFFLHFCRLQDFMLISFIIQNLWMTATLRGSYLPEARGVVTPPIAGLTEADTCEITWRSDRSMQLRNCDSADMMCRLVQTSSSRPARAFHVRNSSAQTERLVRRFPQKVSGYFYICYFTVKRNDSRSRSCTVCVLLSREINIRSFN